MLPPLDLDLKMEQQFLLLQIEKDIHLYSKQQLEDMILDLTKQLMVKTNILASLTKEVIRSDFERMGLKMSDLQTEVPDVKIED